jgi:hypothetical protein
MIVARMVERRKAKEDEVDLEHPIKLHSPKARSGMEGV